VEKASRIHRSDGVIEELSKRAPLDGRGKGRIPSERIGRREHREGKVHRGGKKKNLINIGRGLEEEKGTPQTD